jgi:type IX secretion system PorP/SprF family membrane protein
MKKSITYLLFLGAGMVANAQDIHWSQPSAALLYQNPAFAGVSGKYSIGVNYRDQWSSVNKSYRTFAMMGDYRLSDESQKAQVNAGVLFYKDMSADGVYQVNSGGLNLSCLLNVDEKSKLGAGLYYGFNQSSLNRDRFTWGNQFDGQSYNSALSTGEDHAVLNKTFNDIGAGISYVLHEKAGTVNDNDPDIFMVGYSVSHINRPEVALTGSAERLPMKHTFMMTAIATMNDNRALKPTLLVHVQGKMLEITGGTLFRFGLGQMSRYTGIKKGSAFSAGLLYRFKDALIPTMEFEKGNAAIGISYDVNLSKFSKSSKYQGGLELYLRLKAPGNNSHDEKKEKKERPVESHPLY